MANEQAPTNPTLEQEQLKSLVNSMADGVIAVDKDLKVVLYNGAALNILDVNSTITAKAIDSILPLASKEGNPVNVRQLVSEAKTAYSNRDLLMRYRDGSQINVYVSIAPVHLGYGKSADQGYVLLLRDITREKSLEEERDEFISVVSHELRTPVAITEGNVSNAQLIVEKSGDLAKIKQALSEAHAQIGFLSGLINDLATLSRAERGKLTVDIEKINVIQLVSELCDSYQPEAARKGLELRQNIDKTLELLSSSRLYVREILQNFITNAIKYTDNGWVEITARKKDNGVLFEVIDTGIGISVGDREKIFEKFFRSEDFRTRKNNGTGLGLYVTQKLARLIHAQISLQSELNKGSTFTIFIPNITA